MNVRQLFNKWVILGALLLRGIFDPHHCNRHWINLLRLKPPTLGLLPLT